MNAKQVKAVVEYCGGWGYRPQYNMVDRKIKELYSTAQVEGKAIPGGTGCMEVTVTIDGKT